MTRSRDVADSQDNLGGAVAPFVAGKNAVINGGFDFFQRSPFSTSSTGFGLDRWLTIASGSASATVLTQQTTGAPSGSRYYMRIAMGASGGYGNQFHIIETSNVAQLWGRTATFSVKLRRNSSFAGSLSFSIEKSVTVDAGMGASWVAIASSTASNANLPTGTGSSDWFNASFQVSIPNDGTANSIRIQFGQSQVEVSGAYWEMAQVQLEAGSQQTQFARAGGSIGAELALCQRYYQRLGNLYGYANSNVSIQGNTSAMPMRVQPTVLMTNLAPYAESPPSVTAFTGSASNASGSGDPNPYGSQFIRVNGFSGLTVNTISFVQSGQIALSAEL